MVEDSRNILTSERVELVLFISIDIIGSTAYKNKYPNSKDFSKLFLNFYHSIPRYLFEELCFLSDTNNFDFEPRENLLHLFKVVGDEVILMSNLTSFSSLPIILVGLRNTINKYRNVEFKKTGLDLKATIWLASCPIVNMKIRIPTVPIDEITIIDKIILTDYIGPSMDIGFRLSKYSNENLMTISLEVMSILGSIAEITYDIFTKYHINIIHNL